MKCKCVADAGKKCNNQMSKEEKEQDGMCSECADSLWDLYVLPLWSGRKTKPFLHKELK